MNKVEKDYNDFMDRLTLAEKIVDVVQCSDELTEQEKMSMVPLLRAAVSLESLVKEAVDKWFEREVDGQECLEWMNYWLPRAINLLNSAQPENYERTLLCNLFRAASKAGRADPELNEALREVRLFRPEIK